MTQSPHPSGSWTPRAPHGSPDPRQPLGAAPPSRVSITSYEPPRQRATWVIVAVVGAVLAALAYAGVTVARSPLSSLSPTPSPTASSASPAAATADPTANSVPFHSTRDDAEGVWTITDSTWTDRGLELTMTLEVTRGSFTYQFFCLDNETTEEYAPAPSGATSLNEGRLEAGQKVRGRVVFDKPRRDTTVFLADGGGRQVTALVAEG